MVVDGLGDVGVGVGVAVVGVGLGDVVVGVGLGDVGVGLGLTVVGVGLGLDEDGAGFPPPPQAANVRAANTAATGHAERLRQLLVARIPLASPEAGLLTTGLGHLGTYGLGSGLRGGVTWMSCYSSPRRSVWPIVLELSCRASRSIGIRPRHTAAVTPEAGPAMKYAAVERERRFLPSVPPDLSTASRTMEIDDRYLVGTRLRLRTVSEPGRDVVRKLGQKVRFAAGDASELAHTTMYLDTGEYDLLSALPAVTLAKTRHVLPLLEGLEVAVDVFQGRLSGLTLAELDLGATGLLSQPLPGWLGVEVTGVEDFTGYALACMEAETLTSLLAAYRAQ